MRPELVRCLPRGEQNNALDALVHTRQRFEKTRKTFEKTHQRFEKTRKHFADTRERF